MSPRFEPHPDRRPAAVTGASSGIGEGVARALGAAGFPVVLGARRVERCEEVAAEIRAAGGEAAVAHLDVRDPASVKDFAAAATAAFGPVEVLVSSAGDVQLHSAHAVDAEEFAAQLDLNLVGAQRLVSQIVPGMVERRRGDVVFITSDAVRLPRPMMSSYVAAKWGLEGLARTLQMELEGTGVRASIVRPGPTLTAMGSSWTEEMLAPAVDAWSRWGLARHDRFLRPPPIAAAVVAVVSVPRGSHITMLEIEPEAPLQEEEPVKQPTKVSGDGGGTGHLEELRADPIGLMTRVRDECGDVGEFRMADRRVVLLTGAGANEFFFRSSEEDLDQAEAYPFMTPIFGEGVVFDAPPERRREMLHNQALRDKFMRGHADTISHEVDGMVAKWGDAGEIDLLDWFAELTIYTSSACLIGKRFRDELDHRFAELYHDLERGTDALAYVDPYAPIDSFRRRDAARVALVELVQGIMDRRQAAPAPPDGEGDLLDILMSIKEDDGTFRFPADTVTGMFIAMMFAGHHTTSGTAAWTLIELLRHPDEMAAVRSELDTLYADGSSVSYQALREIPRLESAIKEALRLHPPLILLLRVAKTDLEVDGYRIDEGAMVAASPAVSNRIASDFPDPDAFVPTRYLAPREEDVANPWTWIPFGAGRHRCVGAAFAMMQLKAIFSVLLRQWDFELAQPSVSYRNDHSKMVVQLAQPCRARYARRS